MSSTNLLFLILSMLSLTQCKVNFRDKMYSELHKVWPCITRSNGTHTVGCSSSRYGNIGVVHFVTLDVDLNWVLGSAPMTSYIVVMPVHLFTRDNMEKMNRSSKIEGLLLIPTDEKYRVYPKSPDSRCPNKYSVINGTCDDVIPWNPSGQGILWVWWNIPIFYSDDLNVINQMSDCFRKFNLPLNYTQNERPLCALEMTSYMHSRGLNSSTCLRKEQTPFGWEELRFCEKLGDANLVVPIIPFDSFKKKKYIIFAARLDSASTFYGRAPAVVSTVTSLVMLILAAKLLYELTEGDKFDDYEKNVLFTFFNGEAFDFIGSSRFVYDINQGSFPNKKNPISLIDIDLYVELSQIMIDSDKEPVFYVHTAPEKSSGVSEFLQEFNSTRRTFQYQFNFTEQENKHHIPFPPVSVHSFLKHNDSFPGIVLSSFNDIFTNKFYHSILDDWYNIETKYNQTKNFISEAATTLAHTAYKLMTGNVTSNSIAINDTETDNLLRCYTYNFYCDLFHDLEFLTLGSLVYPNFYVEDSLTDNPWFLMTKYLLIFFMSKKIPDITSERNCTNPKTRNSSTSFLWDEKNKTCRVTNVEMTSAVSPAFEIENYDMKSHNYSTWSQSTWNKVKLRLFLQPSEEYEMQTIWFGLVILYFSFIFIYYLNANVEIYFAHSHFVE